MAGNPLQSFGKVRWNRLVPREDISIEEFSWLEPSNEIAVLAANVLLRLMGGQNCVARADDRAVTRAASVQDVPKIRRRDGHVVPVPEGTGPGIVLDA